MDTVADCDGVVNLVGEGVFNRRWRKWFVELLRRFNLWFHIYDEERCEAAGNRNPFLEAQLILSSITLFTDSDQRVQEALAAGWDILVVDEAHHLHWSPEGGSPAYKIVEELGRKSPGLLLLTATPEQWWGPVFVAIIVAPLTEEVLFRGVILRGLLQRFSTVGAIAISAMLFGLIHLNPWQFVTAVILGCVFGWWYVRTNSLLPSLAGHAVVNGAFVFSSFLPELNGFNTHTLPGKLQPVWLDLSGGLLLLAGLVVFWLGTSNSAAQTIDHLRTQGTSMATQPEAPPVILADSPVSPPPKL